MRQSYDQVDKQMQIARQRDARAKQLNRAAQVLRKQGAWLRRVDRDIACRIIQADD